MPYPHQGFFLTLFMRDNKQCTLLDHDSTQKWLEIVADQRQVQRLNARLKIINSGPVVKLPTTIDFELAIIPEDR